MKSLQRSVSAKTLWIVTNGERKQAKDGQREGQKVTDGLLETDKRGDG